MSNHTPSEESLYPVTKRFLDERLWHLMQPSSGISLWRSAITSRLDIGLGKWGRPDLVAIQVWRNRFSPAMTFDVHTFEVKRRDNVDDLGAYEALSHTRTGHYAHVVCHVGHDVQTGPHMTSVARACQRFGLGLITFTDQHDQQTFNQVFMPATRHNPSGDVVDRCIELAFPDDANLIEKWARDRA